MPASCSASSSVSTAWTSSKALASGSPACAASCSGTEDACGPKAKWIKERHSISPCQKCRRMRWRETMAELKPILLVEDNPKDIELTLAALADNRLANEVIVV